MLARQVIGGLDVDFQGESEYALRLQWFWIFEFENKAFALKGGHYFSSKVVFDWK